MITSFTAIDFETATYFHNSACAVAIVTVNNGVVVDEYYTLIKPPFNEYNWHNIQVHGITPQQTARSPLFSQVFPEIQKRLSNTIIVAHNAPFDKSILFKTMMNYNLDSVKHDITDKWECTLKIYRAKGYKPASLDACCKKHSVKLNHHNALSDAKACAQLFLMHHNG